MEAILIAMSFDEIDCFFDCYCRSAGSLFFTGIVRCV
ncbi:hypothetical protein RB12744 [Rhodopirellula baltica SH 1]|uniref:Uncharacterized protein n=1 Tax=Rhodopirellula baltica (strain DSM 10527 / NCIMB 13988 / SH1) TaxID=243090 RepID=Q7UI60_RHOBA|nr:hypothetical protein RB12744 [Rhodopirellula baltica SH 1]